MKKIIYYKSVLKWIKKNRKNKFINKIEHILLNDQPTINLTNSKYNLRRIRIFEQYRVIFKFENNVYYIIKIANRDEVYKNINF